MRLHEISKACQGVAGVSGACQRRSKDASIGLKEFQGYSRGLRRPGGLGTLQRVSGSSKEVLESLRAFQEVQQSTSRSWDSLECP